MTARTSRRPQARTGKAGAARSTSAAPASAADPVPADHVPVGGGQTAALQRACRFIEAALEAGETPTLKALARHCRISPWHLQRSFRQAMGVTPRQYADALRMGRFRAELQKGDGVAAATYGAGYGSSSRVYERAPAALGMTPATYAKGGLGARISYAVAGSPLGPLLAAATERGICFVALGQAESRLVRALKAEFPAAAIARDRGSLASVLDAIIAFIQGDVPSVDLPLDIRATAFQRRVWEALRRIPAGETRTYAELAAEIGRPGAQRAVGRACATNPIALVVPCHRALRSDGGLGGYRWGLDVKQSLIEGEAAGKIIHRK